MQECFVSCLSLTETETVYLVALLYLVPWSKQKIIAQICVWKKSLKNTCLSFLSIKASGKVFPPMITEIISLSKQENSKLDMRPVSHKRKETDGQMMDSLIAGLTDPITWQLVSPICTWRSHNAELFMEWLKLSDGQSRLCGFLQSRWMGRGRWASHHVTVSIQVEVSTNLEKEYREEQM